MFHICNHMILHYIQFCFDLVLQYNTIQYYTIQYYTIEYNTILYYTILYNTIQYNTIRYNMILYDTVRYGSILWCLRKIRIDSNNTIPFMCLSISFLSIFSIYFSILFFTYLLTRLLFIFNCVGEFRY